MIALLQILLIALYDILPDSPFQTDVVSTDSLDFLPYLNWFVPFDTAETIIALWLPCILAYYYYPVIKSIFMKVFNSFIGS